MPLHDIRSVHFPYCIEQQDDGSFILLNREYLPLGFTTEHVHGKAVAPFRVRIKGLTPRVAALLSFDGKADTGKIYLYNDGCIPTHSAAASKAYFERVVRLMKLKVEPA
jgi:hypothetical protein